MASSGTRRSTSVEIVLLPNLKNCLVNLPASLVSLLLNANTIAQNVVVEIGYRQAQPSSPDTRNKSTTGSAKSVYLGWTGLQSQSRLSPVVGRDGIRGGSGRQEQDISIVEMDATLGRVLGLSDGMKASVSLHLDPPQAHTVSIDPLTATDWEIIELHSSFLETNFLSQVRALPNPAAGHAHPLTLHLTPTSTANISITSLIPPPNSSQPFVKIAPDAEVHVAPKTRQASRPNSARDNRSTASTSRRSVGGRSVSGATARHKATSHDSEKARPPIFLRGLTRSLKCEWFLDGGEEMDDEGLKVWLDRSHMLSKTLRGVTWVTVQAIKPAALQEPVDPALGVALAPEQMPAQKVVAKLCTWEDAPDTRHAALSSTLCQTLGVEGIVGGIVRIDPAPQPLPRTPSALKEPSQTASKDAIVKRLRITPFAATTAEKKAAALRFGGESKAERDEAILKFRAIFARSLLEGPLTDGMLLPAQGGWPGGILDFEPSPPGDPSKNRTNWLIGGERKLDVSMQPETTRPKIPQWPPGEALVEDAPELVGIDGLIQQVRASLLHTSSVLLTGGLGSGKTSVVQLLADQLKTEYLFNIIYLPCRSLVSDEMRVKTVKDTLHRIFASASWGARTGGRALVILDDLDKLCPLETELQVDANGRSRQVSELLCSVVREWCTRESGVVMLATAQGKEAVNNIVIGGHVVRDIIALKAPNKDGRRKVLEMLVRNAQKANAEARAMKRVVDTDAANEWMEGSSDDSRPTSSHVADVEEGGEEEEEEEEEAEINVDLLEVAGQTDGYMPGDLAVLVSRARSEALIRVVSNESIFDNVSLIDGDFTAALKGFTPASLRGVTLQSSTTTFASIGGLKETRRTLLETLQYPTTYAPLFAKCPLRLRSGLLLYGYPGCGKTLLASAVAGECGLNFISVKGPEILNKYIGASEKSVRDLFERAEAAKPCVLFFDEFDSIAPKRGHDSTGVTDRVVNMLLTMMDGAEGLSGVYVLAATSRPDLIDPALLRPGRLDKSLICDMPNEEDRLDILQAISDKLKLDPSVLDSEGAKSLHEVARRTDGYSGADLQAVMYNAHLDAIHQVLGPDSDVAAQDFAKRKPSADPRSPTGGARGQQDFTYFRMDREPSSANGSITRASTSTVVATERAQIAAKLATMQLARRKARVERHASLQRSSSVASRGGPFGGGGTANGLQHDTGKQHQHDEPIIAWHHLAKSLEDTRASISVQERRRLAAIYREFVVGRNGDMSDGQGSSEIGGRTSLM